MSSSTYVDDDFNIECETNMKKNVAKIFYNYFLRLVRC